MPGGITVAIDQDYIGKTAGEALLPLRGQHSLTIGYAAVSRFTFDRV